MEENLIKGLSKDGQVRFIVNDGHDTKRKLAENNEIFRNLLNSLEDLSKDERARAFYEAKLKEKQEKELAALQAQPGLQS